MPTAAGTTRTATASLSAGRAAGNALPWLHRPSSGAMLERLEWLTNVLPAFDGSEQRRALRGSPRRRLEFDVVLEGRQRQRAENALRAWQGLPWIVPLWQHAQPLQAPLAAGGYTLAIDPAGREIAYGELLLLFLDDDTWALMQAGTVGASTVEVQGFAARAWPAGQTTVVPARLCTMTDAAGLSRFTGAVSYGRMQFDQIGRPDYDPADESATLYRGFPVLHQAPNWTEDISTEINRARDTVDGQTGPVYIDSRAAGPTTVQSHRWLLASHEEAAAFRAWLYARRGRLSAFWLPTFAQDFTLAASAASTDTTIDVEACGYTETAAGQVNRRDIRILLASGATINRRITGSQTIGAIERLTLDAALGAAIAPAQVAAISFMSLSRLNADAIEIAWAGPDLAECSAATTGPRHVV